MPIQKLLRVLGSQLAFVQSLFQRRPESLGCHGDEWLQLEARARALQHRALEQEVASQRRIQVCSTARLLRAIWIHAKRRKEKVLIEIGGAVGGLWRKFRFALMRTCAMLREKKTLAVPVSAGVDPLGGRLWSAERNAGWCWGLHQQRAARGEWRREVGGAQTWCLPGEPASTN